MGDLGDDYREWKQRKKKAKDRKRNKFIPIVEDAGAEFKTDGVYRLGNWDLYPSRGDGRNIRTNKYKPIEEIIKKEQTQ